MTTLEKIAEWEKGCSNTIVPGKSPEDCPECTRGLITALKYDTCKYEAHSPHYSNRYLGYITSCGHTHTQIYGAYCPYCGRPVQVLHE